MRDFCRRASCATRKRRRRNPRTLHVDTATGRPVCGPSVQASATAAQSAAPRPSSDGYRVVFF
jgi:hypothetical protein